VNQLTFQFSIGLYIVQAIILIFFSNQTPESMLE